LRVDEYNFGTLIRLNAEDDYTETNSMFGTFCSEFRKENYPFTDSKPLAIHLSSYTGYRVQFYAIEIARNRHGLNDKVWKSAQEEKKNQSS
jgi:hypothetical protein